MLQQLSLRNPYIWKKLGLPEQKVRARDKILRENVLHEKSGPLEHAISAETLSPEKLLDVSIEYIIKIFLVCVGLLPYLPPNSYVSVFL